MPWNATLVLWSHRAALLPSSFVIFTVHELHSESSFPESQSFQVSILRCRVSPRIPDILSCPSFFSLRFLHRTPPSSTSELLSPARDRVKPSNEFSDFSRLPAMSVHMRRRKKTILSTTCFSRQILLVIHSFASAMLHCMFHCMFQSTPASHSDSAGQRLVCVASEK